MSEDQVTVITKPQYRLLVWKMASELEGGAWARKTIGDMTITFVVLVIIGTFIGWGNVYDYRWTATSIALVSMLVAGIFEFIFKLFEAPYALHCDQVREIDTFKRKESNSNDRELQLMEARSFLRTLSNWLDEERKATPSDISLHQERARSVYRGLFKEPMRTVLTSNPPNAEVMHHLWASITSAIHDLKTGNFDTTWKPPEWLVELEKKRLEV